MRKKEEHGKNKKSRREKEKIFLNFQYLVISEHEEGEHGVHASESASHGLTSGGVDLWLLHKHKW